MKEKRVVKKAVYHIIVFVIGIIMIYPLIWMVMSSFKENSTIFSTAGSLIPEKFIVSNYSTGWKGFGKISFATFFKTPSSSQWWPPWEPWPPPPWWPTDLLDSNSEARASCLLSCCSP